MPDDDLGQLLAAHLDDTLDAESASRLHERLRSDEHARRLLLAASCQASALPRIALESGLARAPVAPSSLPAPAASRSWRWSLPVAAALLLIGLALPWVIQAPVSGDVRVDGAVGLTVERAGKRLGAADPWVQAGDRIVAAGGPARLSWTTEGTSIELTTGTQVVVEVLGASKRLRLDHGALRAVVAPQPTGGGLGVITAFGAVDVVGTRFSVQVHDHASTVAVEHGAVRVSAAAGSATASSLMLAAGYAVTTDGVVISTPGPISDLPSVAPGPGAPSAGRLRLSAADFRPDAGWEGDLVDGAIRARPVASSAVTRITTPLGRPDGYARFGQDLRCTLRLSVDRPTTLAVLLVCDHPDGGSAWVGNLQSERRIQAGEQELTIAAADLRQVLGGAIPPTGSRVVAAAVMSWSGAADLRLHWIEFSR